MRTSRLQLFGVGPHAEQTYRLVLRQGECSLESISDLVGRPLSEVRRELAQLAELRLVRVADELARPAPPDLALGRLVGEQQERLHVEENALTQVRAAISQYVLDHESGQDGAWDPVLVDAIDVDDLIATMETLVLNSRGVLRFTRPDQWSLPSGMRMDAIVLDALGAGRASRTLYPDHLRDAVPEAVQSRASAGEEVRVLPHVPFRLAVFGTEAAMLPEHFDRTEGRRLVVRHHALVRALIDLFDLYWERGVAVAGLGATTADDSNHQLVVLLAEGAKDEQMARALGLSLRTVRRRVAALQNELGARSRFQAGVEAVRRGWV
jgi:DNA-binding CsgD family transcriptional regulator